MDVPRIELGMNVWADDGLLVGRIDRVWHPGGSIAPPLPGSPGQPDVVAGAWGQGEDSGILQVNRFQAPDWYIPFADIAGVVGRNVHLAYTEKQGRKRGWQRKPVLSAMVKAGSDVARRPSLTGDRPSDCRARVDAKIAAVLLAEDADLWRASVAQLNQPDASRTKRLT